MANVTRENIGLLTDKLTVSVSQQDYLSGFERKLKEYGKTANIPGFRKGMVPVGMIRKMYGASIFQEEVLRAAEKELFTYLNETKPDIFAQPLPMAGEQFSFNMNEPAEYALSFEIGLKPEVKVPDLSNMKLTMHRVNVSDDMVNEEIDRLRIKGGQMTEPETIDQAENVINALFTETDKDGNAIEGGICKENSLLLKYFTPKMQKQLMGKKMADCLVFSLKDTFEGEQLDAVLHDLGLDKNDSASKEKHFKLDIVKIGLITKRDLDEAFFGEVYPGKGIQNEADFSAALKQDIESYWNSQSRNQLHDQLYHALLDHTSMEFPEAFLKRWLQTGGDKPKTAEEAEHEFPTFKNQLKWTLISDKVITDEKLEVKAEDVREHMRIDVMRYFGQMGMGEQMDWLESYLDRMMKDEKQVDATYRRLITERLFDHLEKSVKPAEKTVTPAELDAMQHHHAH